MHTFFAAKLRIAEKGLEHYTIMAPNDLTRRAIPKAASTEIVTGAGSSSRYGYFFQSLRREF